METWTFLVLCSVALSHGVQAGGGSCRDSCGNEVGNCSCSALCQYRGNCCEDYRDRCSKKAPAAAAAAAVPAAGTRVGRYFTTAGVLAITARPSCRYNCGYYLNGCSCTSSCQYYGNCCYDYTAHCSATTWSPATTARPSCRYNCGYYLNGCSCTSSCQYYGNCCYDYTAHCSATTTTLSPTTTGSPATTARPSCRYNCGYYLNGCSCTSSCQYYGNCCYDYTAHCSATTTTLSPTTTGSPATTAGPSCRYNCGYYLNGCSCTSSCQYYGNCCYDYASYCSVSSTTPPITGHSTCYRNCGRELAACSCASSCQRYGNCCYDFRYYCPSESSTPLPSTVQPCGGYLRGSGAFTSPYYPSYYHDNTYCVWQLRASKDQQLSLSINDLQMENCCSCDYINVYDGASTSSRLLGRVCANSTATTFQSSSAYLTVLFRSDSSVVGRGFHAEFTSSLSPSHGHVKCSSDIMNIVISQSYLNSMGYNGNNLYINDQYCRPQISSYQVVFRFPMTTCGTVKRFENGRVVYTNAVRGYASTYGEITRQSPLKLNVSCRMEQDTTVETMYVAREQSNSSVTGTGQFNGSMAFYTSSSFRYKETQVPYVVSLNQNMYVQVNLLRDDRSLVLFLDTCVASPSPSDFHTRAYDLVRNGCPRDNSYYSYVSGTQSYARFTFKAFQFLRAQESVYLQCHVLICPASDYNSRCRRGCSKRKARDVGSSHASQTLVLGPIRLQDKGSEEGGAPEAEATAPEAEATK